MHSFNKQFIQTFMYLQVGNYAYYEQILFFIAVVDIVVCTKIGLSEVAVCELFPLRAEINVENNINSHILRQNTRFK